MKTTIQALLNAALQRTLTAFQQFESHCAQAPTVVDINYMDTSTLFNGIINSIQEVYDSKGESVDAYGMVLEAVEGLMADKQLFQMWYGNWRVVKEGQVIKGFERCEAENIVRASVISGVVQSRPVARTELH